MVWAGSIFYLREHELLYYVTKSQPQGVLVIRLSCVYDFVWSPPSKLMSSLMHIVRGSRNQAVFTIALFRKSIEWSHITEYMIDNSTNSEQFYLKLILIGLSHFEFVDILLIPVYFINSPIPSYNNWWHLFWSPEFFIFYHFQNRGKSKYSTNLKNANNMAKFTYSVFLIFFLSLIKMHAKLHTIRTSVEALSV